MDNYYGYPEFDNYPVVYVTWSYARTYCEWRGARLPTESEWEKAARGGLEGKLYPWGDEFNGLLASSGESRHGYKRTAPVGSFAPNGYGLYDMAGNVEEWTADWYDVYPGGDPSKMNPYLRLGEYYRVIRGGSWLFGPGSLRVAKRMHSPPNYMYSDLGFRCARDVSP